MDVRVYGYTDNIVFIEWKKIEMEKKMEKKMEMEIEMDVRKMEINKKSYLPEIGFEPMTSGL